jgi:hypothetical protein
MAEVIITKFQAEGLEQYQQELKGVVNETKKMSNATDELDADVNALNEELTKSKNRLKELEQANKQGSAEYKKLSAEVKAVEIAMNSTTGSVSSAKRELRAMTQEGIQLRLKMEELEKSGLKNTQSFKVLENAYLSLKDKAGALKDTIGDVSEEIGQASSDTSNIDKGVREVSALAGAFTAVQGAIGLFGVENEEVEKTLLEVNSAMALSTGSQQFLTEARKKDSLFVTLQTKAQALYNIVVGGSVGVMKALRLAFAGLGIGIIVAGVYLLVKAFQDWNKEANQARQVQKLLNETNKEATQNISTELSELNRLTSIAKNENISKKDRLEAIKQINSNYPEYLGNINLENIGTSETNDLIKEQIKLLTNREKIKILTAKLAEAELKKQRMIEGQELGAITKSRIAINKFFGFQKDATRIKNDAIVSDYKSTLNEIDNLNKALEQVFSEIGTSGASVFDATKNGVQNQNKVVLNELDKLKKELEKKKKELETEISKLVVKEGKTESKLSIDLRAKITGIEGQIRVIENLIKNEPLKIEADIIFTQIESQLQEAITSLENKIKELFASDVFLGANPKDNEQIKLLIAQLEEARNKLNQFKADYENIFKEDEGVQLPNLFEDFDAENFKSEIENLTGISREQFDSYYDYIQALREQDLIDTQTANDAIEKLQNERLQRIEENASKAQEIYGQIFNVISQGTDIARQVIGQNAERELQILEDKKNRGLISERQFQKEVAKIKNEEAQKQRKADIAIATAKIPLIALEAFLSGLQFSKNPIVAGVFAGIATAFAVAQVALIAKAPLPKFKHGGSVADVFKGSGYVKGKSHEQGGVNAELEGNEYVINGKSVNKYGIKNLEKLNKGLLNPNIFSNVPSMPLYKINDKKSSNDFNILEKKLSIKLQNIIDTIHDGNEDRIVLGKKTLSKLEQTKKQTYA